MLPELDGSPPSVVSSRAVKDVRSIGKCCIVCNSKTPCPLLIGHRRSSTTSPDSTSTVAPAVASPENTGVLSFVTPSDPLSTETLSVAAGDLYGSGGGLRELSSLGLNVSV